MRRAMEGTSSNYKFAILDDETGIIDSISVVLKRNGYRFAGFTDPLEAIEKIRAEHFDLLILDYLMEPIHGDQVVERIRKFNKDIYILLLTGHKDLAPPLETIRTLDIQGYCEKSDKFDQLMLLIESGIKSISQMRTIKKFKDGLNKMLQTVPEIYQLRPVRDILMEILEGALSFVNNNNAFILVDDDVNGKSDEEDRSIYCGSGKYDIDHKQFMTKANFELLECIGIAKTDNSVVRYVDGIVFPILNEQKKSIGAMFVEGVEGEDTVKLLEIYSKQASSSISNAFLHSLVSTKNQQLNVTYEELKKRYIDTIEVLRLAVDAKDVYTRGHSDRVAFYAVKIGKAFGLDASQLELLRLGGIFHDVGKIGTADDILFKTESLDRMEYTEVKKHTLKGAHILSAVSMFKDVVPLVKYHHERIDGRGYPEGLKCDEIPFLSRILSVADAFDAMTSDRLYRSKLDLSEAVKQLKSAAGTQFDTIVVEKFIELLEDYEKIREETSHTFEGVRA